MATRKRPALNNPAAMAFILPGTGNKEPQAEKQAATVAGTDEPTVKERIVYMKPETKSEHFHALLKPTNLKKAKEQAKKSGISLNEYLNRLIEQDA